MLYEPIHDVKGKGWCGPTAISSITQTPISTIQKMVRRVRSDCEKAYYGRRIKRDRKLPVRGMYKSEVVQVMKRLKFKTSEFKPYTGTLAAFCDDRAHLGPFIVQVTGHFVAVSQGMICDTWSKKPVPWREHPLLRKQVKFYARF
jgi:hypothetical protein